MARAKISEFRAKTMFGNVLGVEYAGLSVDTAADYNLSLEEFVKSKQETFVVKVDQAVKKRNKLGLVFLDIGADAVSHKIIELKQMGYRWVLVEPFVAHDSILERFVALQREADGIHVSYSVKGGVDIESHPESIRTYIHGSLQEESNVTDYEFFRKLIACFEDNHFTYLEINPYIARDGEYILLDAAVEVDTSAEFFVKNGWTSEDLRNPKKEQSIEEQSVEELSSKSPSSLNLKVLNRDGSIFLLLSGGGASVVVADEFSSLGHHEDIANYGEYSGNPTEEETYLYTKQVINLVLNSRATKKVLLVAGGVANFTDISKTFNGIIHALQDNQDGLLEQDVCVLVRRGGPNQNIGLSTIKSFLEKTGLRHVVHGPDVSLAGIVALAVKEL